MLARPPFMASCRYCLVTSIDSIEDLADLPSLISFLSRRNHKPVALGTGLVVDLPALEDMLSDPSYFTGFDEIWLCRDMPQRPKPKHVQLTSGTLGENRLQGLPEWMQEASCVVGMGDGGGFVYVTTEPAVAGHLASLDLP